MRRKKIFARLGTLAENIFSSRKDAKIAKKKYFLLGGRFAGRGGRTTERLPGGDGT